MFIDQEDTNSAYEVNMFSSYMYIRKTVASLRTTITLSSVS
jgi:hypothetical protein